MASEAIFQRWVEITLGFEGGYSDDPHDPGGETNFGISKRSYPNEDIANMTRERAIAIYHRDFWEKPAINTLPNVVAGKVFDLAVNLGARAAIRLLQRALNHEGATPLLATDGVIGPATRTSAEQLAGTPILNRLRAEAANHYVNLATVNPTLRRYLRGWLRRASA